MKRMIALSFVSIIAIAAIYIAVSFLPINDNSDAFNKNQISFAFTNKFADKATGKIDQIKITYTSNQIRFHQTEFVLDANIKEVTQKQRIENFKTDISNVVYDVHYSIQNPLNENVIDVNLAPHNNIISIKGLKPASKISLTRDGYSVLDKIAVDWSGKISLEADKASLSIANIICLTLNDNNIEICHTPLSTTDGVAS